MRGPIVPREQIARPRGIDENFRTFRTGPQSERGGTIACTRSRPEVARPPKVTLRRPEDQGRHDALDHVEDRLLPSNRRSATLSIRPFRST